MSPNATRRLLSYDVMLRSVPCDRGATQFLKIQANVQTLESIGNGPHDGTLNTNDLLGGAGKEMEWEAPWRSRMFAHAGHCVTPNRICQLRSINTSHWSRQQ